MQSYYLGTETQKECFSFICVSSGRCIPSSKKCDGIVDCIGDEDESQCAKSVEDNEFLLGPSAELTKILELNSTTVKP